MIKIKIKRFFKGYKAMAIYPFILIKKDANFNCYDLNHEKIHLKQQKELFIIFFYLKYIYYHFKYGYYKNPFEVEAYKYEHDLNYLNIRKKKKWKKYTR
jgi:hypothetical protein